MTMSRTQSASHIDGDRWRKEFEIPRQSTFLNHASFGPVPRTARKAVEALLRKQGRFTSDPDVDHETFSLLDESRRMFATISGANARHVAFAPNASYGLNAILHGLNLKKGSRILVPENEFPAAVYAVRSMCERIGAKQVAIPCPSGSMDLEKLRTILRRGADVLVMSWVQYFNGFRNDLAMIGRLCREHGCFFLVDVTQGAGAVPLNMRRDGVDAIACGTQKWLLGQTGGGFYAISPTSARDVKPAYGGWLGYDWGYTWGDLQRWNRPRLPDGRYWEVGTYPFYSVRLVHAGLSLLANCGIKSVFSRIQGLHARLIEGLEASQYQPLLLGTKHNRSGIVSLAGPKTADLYNFLKSKNIFVSLREGNIRVSPHFYNTGSEIDRLSNAIIQFERKFK